MLTQNGKAVKVLENGGKLRFQNVNVLRLSRILNNNINYHVFWIDIGFNGQFEFLAAASATISRFWLCIRRGFLLLIFLLLREGGFGKFDAMISITVAVIATIIFVSPECVLLRIIKPHSFFVARIPENWISQVQSTATILAVALFIIIIAIPTAAVPLLMLLLFIVRSIAVFFFVEQNSFVFRIVVLEKDIDLLLSDFV